MTIDRTAILRELARADMLDDFSQKAVRGFKDQVSLWAFLYSLGAPDTVHAAAGTPVAKSTEEFSRQDIEKLVNEHLIALGIDPAPISRPDSSDLDRHIIDREWFDKLTDEREEGYELGIRIGLKPITAAILNQSGPAWIPLHRLISVGISPYGLYTFGGRRFLVDAGDKV